MTRKQAGALVAAFFFILALDQLSKWLTQVYLPLGSWREYPYGGVEIFKNFLGIEFSLIHTINWGAAWGIFASYPFALVVFRLVLISALTLYLFLRPQPLSWQIPLTLILAGAIGNILDYFIYGHVIDMFHFVFWGYNFPVFNIADSAITVGVSWMILFSCFFSKPSSNFA